MQYLYNRGKGSSGAGGRSTAGRSGKAGSRSRARGCWISFFVFFAVCVFLFLFIGLAGGLLYLRTIPTLEELTPSDIAETSKVYALDGSLISEFHAEENREIVPFSRMSENIKKAIISVEDKRYYDHQGVDYRRIIGAFIADVRTGSTAQGASTITMQYIKNVYFTPEKTLRRKINEALIAIQLERNYTKDKILEMYLNTIYFGAGAYGVEKASQTYFDISADNLDIPQAALLAALVKAPEIYNPFNDLEKAKGRRNLVLKLMYEQGKIDKEQYLEAITAPIIINTGMSNNDNGDSQRIAPYFIDYVKQQLYDKKFTDYDVFKGGLRIYTTLDISLQEKAEEAVKTVFPQDPGPSYALISLDPGSGYILALIGGKDYNQSKFNTATQGKRQPGSIFKVPVLMESIRQNFSPNDKYNPNGPITIDMPSGPDWVVHNYGDAAYETNEMTVIDATIHSVNIVYAQLMMKVGSENVEKMLGEMSIQDIGSNPAIALGGLENGITPLDISKLFSTLAANGVYREPVCILKITDSSGNTLYEYDPDKNENNSTILDAPAAYYTTKILERVILEGTGKGASIGRPAAGKTGTTSDYRDAWFGGYTPELATVVWMGYLESSKPMDKINGRTVVGGTFPADIWREFMISALKDRPVTDFTAPEGAIIDVQVCLESGLLPTFWCPGESLGFRIFTKGKEPTEVCNIHNKIAVPDVVGMNIDDARQIFAGLNFSLNEIYQFNETYGENIIYGTDPQAGTVLESLTGEPPGITIYISRGLETVDMPDVTGMILDKAERIVKSLNLSTPDVVYDFSLLQPADKVFAQDPPAMSKVNKNTKITLFISKGENPEGTIPDVIGMDEAGATEKLETAGFKNISVIYEENVEEIGLVFSQVPESGTLYIKAFEVIIKISQGVKVPDVTGMKKSDAVTLLENLGFTVNILPEKEAAGKVKSQSPEKNTHLEYGSTVEIVIEVTGSTETTDSAETTATTGP